MCAGTYTARDSERRRNMSSSRQIRDLKLQRTLITIYIPFSDYENSSEICDEIWYRSGDGCANCQNLHANQVSYDSNTKMSPPGDSKSKIDIRTSC